MAELITKQVKTNNYSSFVIESGNKNNETIILLHGGGPGSSALSNWEDIIPQLSDQFHVIAPDIVGHGRTDHPEDMPKSVRGWMRLRVNQILALMDELEIESAHLVGNSMGGALSMHLVMTQPERFNRVTLMGSAGGKMTPTLELERMANFYKDPSVSALENLTKWFVYDESTISEKIAAISEDRYQEVMRPEVRRSYESFFSTSPAEMAVPPSALRRMEHPFLLIHGREDCFVLPESSIYLQQHLKNAQLHIFDKCGHWVQIEKKNSFIKLLVDFLNNEY